jgi:hypothetical protein
MKRRRRSHRKRNRQRLVTPQAARTVTGLQSIGAIRNRPRICIAYRGSAVLGEPAGTNSPGGFSIERYRRQTRARSLQKKPGLRSRP